MLTKSGLKIPLFLIIVTCSHMAALAQTKESTGMPDLTSLKGELKNQVRPTELRTAVPMDAPLNAAEYPVGPGDELALSIWSLAPMEYRMVVTPEASLLIPNVGRVEVGDASLDSLRSKVARLVGRKYRNADVTLTLMTPRKVVVQINGFVINEGRKEAYATQRVDDLIAMSNTFPTEKLTIDEYASRLRQLMQEASERRIVLKRRDGQAIHVDLPKYRATGQGRYNPYLKEGDIIFVPQRTPQDVQIGVYGGVMNRANFEYAPGDSLSTLIGMALGFQENTDPEHAILTRLSDNGKHMDSLSVDALAISLGKKPDIALRPGDRLVIPSIPEQRLDFHIMIQGEVLRPGSYPIARGTTRLSEAISTAGGFSSLANLHASTILRFRSGLGGNAEAVATEELLNRRAALGAMDTAYYNTESALRTQGEFVSVDFSRVFLHADSSQDVILQPDDRIVVPSLSKTVFVFGQVVQPGHVPLVAGKDFKYYVDQTGGFTEEARPGDVKVIKAGTRVWLDPTETQVEDGDNIWVPKQTQYPFTYYMTIYAQAASILGAIATVALLVRSF